MTWFGWALIVLLIVNVLLNIEQGRLRTARGVMLLNTLLVLGVVFVGTGRA